MGCSVRAVLSTSFLESHGPRLPARAGRCLGKGGFRSAAQEAAAGDTWRFFLHGFFMAPRKLRSRESERDCKSSEGEVETWGERTCPPARLTSRKSTKVTSKDLRDRARRPPHLSKPRALRGPGRRRRHQCWTTGRGAACCTLFTCRASQQVPRAERSCRRLVERAWRDVWCEQSAVLQSCSNDGFLRFCRTTRASPKKQVPQKTHGRIVTCPALGPEPGPAGHSHCRAAWSEVVGAHIACWLLSHCV